MLTPKSFAHLVKSCAHLLKSCAYLLKSCAYLLRRWAQLLRRWAKLFKSCAYLLRRWAQLLNECYIMLANFCTMLHSLLLLNVCTVCTNRKHIRIRLFDGQKGKNMQFLPCEISFRSGGIAFFLPWGMFFCTPWTTQLVSKTFVSLAKFHFARETKVLLTACIVRGVQKNIPRGRKKLFFPFCPSKNPIFMASFLARKRSKANFGALFFAN